MPASDSPSPTPANLNVTNNVSSSNANPSPQSAELAAVVDELLNQLSSKFAKVSKEMFAKMDDMSRRLDNLEATLRVTEHGKDGEEVKRTNG